ncbi:MAG: hypothetical protein JWO73_829 [Candidatus Taylorbacteria bacterium]|nr:hypothetical protein [Candidatus Taylorbacteria bacterium]
MHFEELRSPDWNQATISTVGCIVFILLGGIGQCVQIRKIWKSEDAARVSLLATLAMSFFFSAYFVRGIVETKVMFLAQGTIRVVLYIPIIIGIFRFGASSRKDWAMIATALFILGSMVLVDAWRVPGFFIASTIAVIANIHQAKQVLSGNGKVSMILYVTMWMSVSFQTWYGWHFKEYILLASCSCFAIVYTIILSVMLKNKLTKSAAQG